MSKKGQFATKGPYKVLGEATPGSYWVQKILFSPKGRQRTGKPRKARTMHMEKLPSTLCVHKRTDGIDNRFLGLN